MGKLSKQAKFLLVTVAVAVGPTLSNAEGTNGPQEENVGSVTMPNLEPVRQTTGRVRIYKSVVQRTPGGGYSLQNSDVCQKDIVIDVFDGRNLKSFGYTVKPALTCDSEIDGQKVELMGNAVIVLRSESAFKGDPVLDVRSNSFNLISVDPVSTTRRAHAGAQVVSRDLTAPVVLRAEESFTWDCGTGSCGPSATEYFSATIEFGP